MLWNSLIVPFYACAYSCRLCLCLCVLCIVTVDERPIHQEAPPIALPDPVPGEKFNLAKVPHTDRHRGRGRIKMIQKREQPYRTNADTEKEKRWISQMIEKAFNGPSAV
jgi:hypothetical protein